MSKQCFVPYPSNTRTSEILNFYNNKPEKIRFKTEVIVERRFFQDRWFGKSTITLKNQVKNQLCVTVEPKAMKELNSKSDKYM